MKGSSEEGEVAFSFKWAGASRLAFVVAVAAIPVRGLVYLIQTATANHQPH
jgi:hypothetical protein